MLQIGQFRTRTCAGLGRRPFLQMAASVAAGMGISPAERELKALASVAPRAKSVIFVFLWGAPSHLDTFDPKPGAPLEYRGPFESIATATIGARISELLPRIAACSDRFTLIRTHATTAPGHPDAGTVALTGFEELPAPVQPNFGSIIARHRGGGGRLPPFFSIARGIVMDGGRRIEGYGGGTLSSAWDPMLVGCTREGQVEIPSLQLLDQLNPLRIQDRRSLLETLDRVPRAAEGEERARWDRNLQSAYDLLLTPRAREAFDLTRETDATRARYGHTQFGQSSLLARRLVEAEVPYVQLNYCRHVEAINPGFEFGWDTHAYNFELLRDWHCPILDRAYPALLNDLAERGLLETTLLVMMGEFGRTPRINPRAARDHWPACYFSLWAGAGIEPGRVIGSSDNLGEHPRNHPVTPLMVGTTIAQLAGLDTQTRAELNVLTGGQVIEGLL